MRIRELEGRPHFVVPMVMMTVGVRNGIFYTNDELEKSATHWNGKPVVVHHPTTRGTAGDPNVANRQKIGTVYNARFNNGRLTAEAWIDAEQVAKVDRRVLQAINTDQVMEISTGLYFGSGDPIPGVYEAQPYEFIGRIYIPDHLAILPDQIGACSIADGCGLMRNQSLEKPMKTSLFSTNNQGHACSCNRQPLGVPVMQWDKPTETPQAASRHRTATNERGDRQSTGQAVAGGSRKPLGAPTFNQLFAE